MNRNDLEDVSIGLNFPIQRSDDGYFDKTFTSLEQVKANLVNLLATRKGERIMRPEFGTNLETLLFEQMTGDIETEITSEIETAVDQFLPQVNIEEVEIQENLEENAIAVNVTFNTVFTFGDKEENIRIWFRNTS